MNHFSIDGYVGSSVVVQTYGTDPYGPNGEISVGINGEPVEVIRVSRDGGTTYIHTNRGDICFPSALSHEDTTPTFNGEPINEF